MKKEDWNLRDLDRFLRDTDIENRQERLNYALVEATAADSAEIVALLLKYGAHLVNDDLLGLAVQSRSLRVVAFLIASEKNRPTQQQLDVALVKADVDEIYRLLLDAGANPNALTEAIDDGEIVQHAAFTLALQEDRFDVAISMIPHMNDTTKAAKALTAVPAFDDERTLAWLKELMKTKTIALREFVIPAIDGKKPKTLQWVITKSGVSVDDDTLVRAVLDTTTPDNDIVRILIDHGDINNVNGIFRIMDIDDRSKMKPEMADLLIEAGAEIFGDFFPANLTDLTATSADTRVLLHVVYHPEQYPDLIRELGAKYTFDALYAWAERQHLPIEDTDGGGGVQRQLDFGNALFATFPNEVERSNVRRNCAKPLPAGLKGARLLRKYRQTLEDISNGTRNAEPASGFSGICDQLLTVFAAKAMLSVGKTGKTQHMRRMMQRTPY